ncbi:MAG: 2-vinyl bacteriochlorophyllide hydratase [Pseudomonadota bacterium]
MREGCNLYTPEQRKRRDQSIWTPIQGVLAIAQFAVFLVSLALVIRFLLSGHGEQAAALSILVKTGVLLTIMVTGAIWERVVFGQYLFAPAFFWEDVVSFGVIALHVTYVIALFSGWGSPTQQMIIALLAYTAYAVNAAQFVLKLRRARLEGVPAQSKASNISGVAATEFVGAGQ